MKKFAAVLLIFALLVIPLNAFSAILEMNENEYIYIDLPYGWDINENKRLFNSDGNVGFADGKSLDSPTSDPDNDSLAFLKSKLLNNIMLVETIGSYLHIYEADTTSGTAFVFTLFSDSLDYIFILCAYQNKILYTNFKNMAQSASIEAVNVQVEIEPAPLPETIPEPEPEPDPIPELGYILSTDIVAYIDDMPINSYNIDGQTVVIVEDLAKYGFKVTWDGDLRKLSAVTVKRPVSAPEFVSDTSDLPVGTPVGAILATDIVTEINGRVYDSYNINGQTAVALESLGDRMIDTETNIFNSYKYSSGGFMTLWDNDTRTIRMYCLRPGDTIKTFVNDMEINPKTAVMSVVPYTWTYYTHGESAVGLVTVKGKTFVDLEKYCEVMNINVTSDKQNTITLDVSQADFDAEITGGVAYIEKYDILLPLNLIITDGRYTARSNNADIAYYYMDGSILVDIEVLANFLK